MERVYLYRNDASGKDKRCAVGRAKCLRSMLSLKKKKVSAMQTLAPTLDLGFSLTSVK